MKRILITLLGLSLVFVFACKRYGHVAMHPIAQTGEKAITIAISDDGSGGFILEASLPKKAYLKKGQRAHWIVINNTEKAVVSYALIYDFLDSGGNKDPFEGGPDDQKFEFKTPIGAGDQSDETSNKARAFPGSVHRDFKYKVKVIVAGVADPLTVDPVVVVGD